MVFSRYNMQDVLKALQPSRTRPPWQTNIANRVIDNKLTEKREGDIRQFGLYLSEVADAATIGRLRAQILHQLDFRDRNDRHGRIPRAHEETFQWIFARQSELNGKSFHSFADWLESEKNLYWITGKPGSGKSTLMKFIITDPRTKKHLQVWSGGMPLVTASFYFWNSGSDVQMSLLGMLRTLLYEALSQWPALIPTVFPNRWATSRLIGEVFHPWTEPELLSAMNTLIQNCKSSWRLCLFIDGIDEFSGSHEFFVELINRYMPLRHLSR